MRTNQKLVLTNNHEMKIDGLVKDPKIGTYAVVPRSAENIISIQQLADKGMMCIMTADHITIMKPGYNLRIDDNFIQTQACRHIDGLFRIPINEFCDDLNLQKSEKISNSLN